MIDLRIVPYLVWLGASGRPEGLELGTVRAAILEVLQGQTTQGGQPKVAARTEAIHLAVDAGDLAKVRSLLEAHPEWLNVRDPDDRTPLQRACLNRQTLRRQVEIAKFLIHRGANVNVVDNWNQTPLIAASIGYGPDFDLIKPLVDAGADINRKGRNGITALHWAAQYGDLRVARYLLQHGAEVNTSDPTKGPLATSTIHGTVLQVALRGGAANLELVRLIVEHGAELNHRDAQGNTEMHLVARSGSAALARLLVQHGADVHAVNTSQHTALYYAAKHGYRSVAEVLLAAGADPKTIVETNYGKAKELTQRLRTGEAYLWPLRPMGSYAVKTKGNLLVFTMEDASSADPEGGLANGNLHSGELAGQKVTILLNHMERMQLEAEPFLAMATLIPAVKVVASFKPDFKDATLDKRSSIRFPKPHETVSLGGIKVHVIPASAGGVGYLVEADGVKIFHAGLHVSENNPESLAKFRKEIDFLKPFGPIDIVMLTVHSHSNKVEAEFEPYLYLIDQLAPSTVYLSGANPGSDQQYLACADVLRARNLPVYYPGKGGGVGDRSHFQKPLK